MVIFKKEQNNNEKRFKLHDEEFLDEFIKKWSPVFDVKLIVSGPHDVEGREVPFYSKATLCKYVQDNHQTKFTFYIKEKNDSSWEMPKIAFQPAAQCSTINLQTRGTTDLKSLEFYSDLFTGWNYTALMISSFYSAEEIEKLASLNFIPTLQLTNKRTAREITFLFKHL